MGICCSKNDTENGHISNALKGANNSVELFSLDGKHMYGKVVNVYDGDTCKIVFEIDGMNGDNRLVRFNCRMNGYDSPEMRPPKNKPDREFEIKAAKAAKQRLISLVMSHSEKVVFVKCGKFDKYGRLLVDIYDNRKMIYGNELSVNQIMMNEGHGYAYDGGRKKSFKRGSNEVVMGVAVNE